MSTYTVIDEQDKDNRILVKNSKLGIAPNSRNSCYIDATFELLCNAVMPFFDLFDDITYESSNLYDKVLVDSFMLYSDVFVDLASTKIREFVWKIRDIDGKQRFLSGEQGDCVELFTLTLEKISPLFASHFCNFAPDNTINRHHTCSENIDHCHYTVDDFYSYIDLDPNMRTALAAFNRKCYFDEDDLATEFSSIFKYQKLYRTRTGKCNNYSCSGKMRHSNLVDHTSLPPFLFVGDPSNNLAVTRQSNIPDNLYMPSTLKICDGVEYELHAKVYSTSPRGLHFYTVCYKVIDNKTYLVRICNLSTHIIIITSNMQKAKTILKYSDNTVYACYKKKET